MMSPELEQGGVMQGLWRMFRAAPAAAAPFDYGRDELILAARDLSIRCVPLDQGHFLQVTRLALRLFDYLKSLHRRDDDDRVMLQLAALLHDIGWVDGRQGHHKNSMRRILLAEELPLPLKERRLVALIARYHRRTLPSDRHPLFGSLSEEDKRKVRELACLLRIADGLDYSHDASVADLAVEISSPRVLVLCSSDHPLDRDLERAAGKGSECFESLFGRKLVIRWHHI